MQQVLGRAPLCIHFEAPSCLHGRGRWSTSAGSALIAAWGRNVNRNGDVMLMRRLALRRGAPRPTARTGPYWSHCHQQLQVVMHMHTWTHTHTHTCTRTCTHTWPGILNHAKMNIMHTRKQTTTALTNYDYSSVPCWIINWIKIHSFTQREGKTWTHASRLSLGDLKDEPLLWLQGHTNNLKM